MTAAIRRVLVTFAGLALLAGGLYVLTLLAGASNGFVFSRGGLSLSVAPEVAYEPWWALGAAIALAVGLLWMLVGLGGPVRVPERALTISPPDDDALRVTLSPQTMQTMLLIEARTVDGVRDLESWVRREDSGWRVRCRVAVWRGVDLAAVSRAVAERLRTGLQTMTGVPITHLDLDLTFAQQTTQRVVR